MPSLLNDTHPGKRAGESVLIIGASLSGLMTGLALARAGLTVTILERVGPEPRSGAALQVDGGDIDRTATAKYLRTLTSGGIRSIEAWSSVQSRLLKEIQANPAIKIYFNKRIQTVSQDAKSASVITDKGETYYGDILIGADGHRSIVRQQVAPHKPNSTFAGYLIWVAIVDETNIQKNHRPDLHASVSMPEGIGDFLLGSVIAGQDGSRVLGKRRLGWAWYDNTRNDLLRKTGCLKGTVVQHSLTGPDIPENTLKELAKQATARWPQPWLDATLHSIKTKDLTAIPISEYIPDKLVNGRMALVGDAAHAITPITASGFNASLKDAASLADCISEETEIEDALLKYESERLNNVRQAVQSGQSFSKSFGR